MPTLDFKGKQFVYSHHLSVPFRELQVVADKSMPAEGKKPALDDNLIIHGDNLEALKALLPTHAGKVDCIFIDPPYNTGNEGWCYNDNVRSPLMKEWLKKSANPVDKEDLERHDKWLCMMWPRLNLLRDLLSDSGVIFITISDIEVHRLRMLLDEVFGENNFLADIAWQKKQSPQSDAINFSDMHDHLISYAKIARHEKSDATGWQRNLVAISDGQAARYSNADNDPRGPWTDSDYTCNKTAIERPNLYYPIINPNDGTEVWPSKTRVWAYDRESHKKNFEERLIWWPSGRKKPRIKKFVEDDKEQGAVPGTWWSRDLAGDNQESKREMLDIFGVDSSFQTPKPTRLISRILAISTNRDSLILDSFAGSGTTAQAVLDANKRDSGSRRFILVECEDYADTLTAERVRRVIKGYPYTGTQRDELHRENITWSTFEKRQAKVLDHIASIENLQGHEYDKISKQIKDGVLTVTGERKVKETAPGLGGSFTYCTLGEPIDIESLLTGKGLPAFDALARYVFYTATGQSLEKVGKPSADGLIGETDLFRVHLFYQPDKEWLRSNDAAINAERMAAIEQGNRSGKRAIVFAVAKFMSQKELTARRIEFCQLPYAVHRILGD